MVDEQKSQYFPEITSLVCERRKVTKEFIFSKNKVM